MYSREVLRDTGERIADARALAAACEQTLICGTTLLWNNRKRSRKCDAARCGAEGSWQEDEGRKSSRRKSSAGGGEIELLGIFNDIIEKLDFIVLLP
jgi:hypothetical protein